METATRPPTLYAATDRRRPTAYRFVYELGKYLKAFMDSLARRSGEKCCLLHRVKVFPPQQPIQPWIDGTGLS